jgi:hypothetical protein
MPLILRITAKIFTVTDLKTDGNQLQSLSDRELLERVSKQIEHLDLLVHTAVLHTTELVDVLPLARKAAKLMDNPVARHLRRRTDG